MAFRPCLIDHATGAYIRAATYEETLASYRASRPESLAVYPTPGNDGVIDVDGRACHVITVRGCLAPGCELPALYHRDNPDQRLPTTRYYWLMAELASSNPGEFCQEHAALAAAHRYRGQPDHSGDR